MFASQLSLYMYLAASSNNFSMASFVARAMPLYPSSVTHDVSRVTSSTSPSSAYLHATLKSWESRSGDEVVVSIPDVYTRNVVHVHTLYLYMHVHTMYHLP